MVSSIKAEHMGGNETHLPPPQLNNTMPFRASSQPVSIVSMQTPPASDSSGSASNSAVDGATDMHNASTSSAMETLGSHSRELIRAIQKLEVLNIDATLPSLPKFIVIGDQSSGKSSIIEAVCDISLPRSEGTCTRCPFQITTTAIVGDQSWSCRVSLHRKYAFHPPARAGQDGVTFDQWLDQKDLVVYDFTTVYSKHDLEIALRRAQLAVLNPQKDHASFVNVPEGEIHTASIRVGFSPNVISLEITAPGVPELSFYDLPGAINTMIDESQQFLVDFVRDLLTSYILDEKALILLACAANQDLEVSTALRFLRECRATRRTMGVLTKPDCLEMTSKRLEKVRLMLVGEEYVLGDGWFVTRSPSQTELDRPTPIRHGEARALEARFFNSHPWTDVLAPHTDRFRIPNLQNAISQKLTAHILNDLPEIIERVQARLARINDKLASFPEQARAPSLTVNTEIDRVKSEIIAQINAHSLTSKFRTPYRAAIHDFAAKVKECEPGKNLQTPGYVKPSILLTDSDAEEQTPSKTRKVNSGRAVGATPKRSAQKAPQRTPQAPHTSFPQIRPNVKVVFRLDEVKAKFDSAPGADLPGHQTPPSVINSLALEPVLGWRNIADGVIRKVKAMFEQMLGDALGVALSQRQGTELFRQVDRVTRSLCDELMQELTVFIHRLVAAETHRPITYNALLMQKSAANEIELRKERQETRAKEYYETLEGDGYKVSLIADQKKKASDATWVNTTLGADDYEREVRALATPLAYYDIASAALVDNVAKQFEYGLMCAYESRIKRKLLEDLNAVDAGCCARLLAEDPEREQERINLLQELAKLEQALAELNGLPGSHA